MLLLMIFVKNRIVIIGAEQALRQPHAGRGKRGQEKGDLPVHLSSARSAHQAPFIARLLKSLSPAATLLYSYDDFRQGEFRITAKVEEIKFRNMSPLKHFLKSEGKKIRLRKNLRYVRRFGTVTSSPPLYT